MSKQKIFTEVNFKIENVWKKFAPKIYKLCKDKSNSREAADDLFQEVALKFCKSAQSLDLNGPLYRWFSTVVCNAHYDQYRREHRELSLSKLAENQCGYEVYPTSASVHYHDERRSYRASKELEFLMTPLNSLERKAVELNFILEISIDEVCGMLGTPRYNLMKSRLGALEKMRKKKDERDEIHKKNDAPAFVLEDLLTSAL